MVSKSFKNKGGAMSTPKFDYNYHALRKLIINKYDTLSYFCRNILNITPTYFSRILSGYVEFSQNFISKTVDALNIDPKDIGFYFFTKECQKVEN